MVCDHKPITDDKRGETICSVCGEVLDENYVAPGKEFVSHGDESSKRKEHYGAGSSYRRADKGLGTKIGYYDNLPRARPPRRKEEP